MSLRDRRRHAPPAFVLSRVCLAARCAVQGSLAAFAKTATTRKSQQPPAQPTQNTRTEPSTKHLRILFSSSVLSPFILVIPSTMLNGFLGSLRKAAGYASDGEVPASPSPARARQQERPRSPPERALSVDSGKVAAAARRVAKKKYNVALENTWKALEAAEEAVGGAAACGRRMQTMLNDLDALRTDLTKGLRDEADLKKQLGLVQTKNKTDRARLIHVTNTIKDWTSQFGTRTQEAIQVEEEYAPSRQEASHIKSAPIHQVDQDVKAVLDLFPKEPPRNGHFRSRSFSRLPAS